MNENLSFKEYFALIPSFCYFDSHQREEKRSSFATIHSSSVYSNDPSLWGTQYATDGLHSFYKNTFIFESQLETSLWIMVTLDGPLLLSFVRVYNRGDCCGKLSLLSCLPPFLHFQKMFHLYSLSCYLSVENNYKLVKK